MARGRPEHDEVRLPLVDDLVHLGWKKDQIRYQPEWRVPATPHDASKRERGASYSGFPTDLVIFDKPENADDADHVVIIFETKKPDELSGRKQLEIYLNMEPSAKLGVWTNGSSVLRIYRDATGKLISKPGMGLPKPKESFLLQAEKRLTWDDLEKPNTKQLKERFARLLNILVARDNRSTRRDDQLNQICNLLLVKLESDKAAKADPGTFAEFQMWESEEITANRIKDYFHTLRGSHSDLFDEPGVPSIDLNDHTISLVAYEIGNFRLFDTPLEVMSQAFQVFRTAALKSEEGQYFTPYPIIQSVVKIMDIHPKDMIIDPACGTGGFLLEAFKALRDCYPKADAKDWAQRRLFGLDKDRINIKLTKAMMLIVGDGSTHVFRADSLNVHTWKKNMAMSIKL